MGIRSQPRHSLVTEDRRNLTRSPEPLVIILDAAAMSSVTTP
jgi:hypothetical protein